MVIPDDKRKEYPVATGVLDYFPDALAAIAHVSYMGNKQHDLGPPFRWDRSKSTDEADALIRHFLQRGTLDSDGLSHTAKCAWRCLAILQKEIESAQDNGKECFHCHTILNFPEYSHKCVLTEELIKQAKLGIKKAE
jgi:hypothetical protein